LSDSTLGRIVRRSLLYVGLAVAALAGIGLLVAIRIHTSIALTSGWIGLVGYTSLLLWVTISRSRERWHRPMFWLAVVGLLVVHLLTFAEILRSYAEWRMIWFLPVVIFEAGLFSIILNVLLGYDAKRQ
jgi:hypothetical protein